MVDIKKFQPKKADIWREKAGRVLLNGRYGGGKKGPANDPGSEANAEEGALLDRKREEDIRQGKILAGEGRGKSTASTVNLGEHTNLATKGGGTFGETAC